MKFELEQIAICPKDPEAAIELLKNMGAEDWVTDLVVARGIVNEDCDIRKLHPLARAFARAANELAGERRETTNVAELNFNYTMRDEDPFFGKPLEFEVLSYEAGRNWMEGEHRVSHLGMHCSEEELEEWREFFGERNIGVAQEVHTASHTNPAIAGKRQYHYCIFNTHDILGVDIKFIVRRNVDDGFLE